MRIRTGTRRPGVRRRPAVVVAPLLLLLAACDIPGTGVVEAGGPASGVPGATPLYWVESGRLVPVHRPTDLPGDAVEAVRLLLGGPAPDETRAHLTTEVPAVPGAHPTAEVPAVPGGTGPVPASPGPPEPGLTPSAGSAEARNGGLEVSVRGDGIDVRLPPGYGRLPALAARQVVCTAAAAHRAAAPWAGVITVSVASGGRRAERTDEDCPEP